MKTAQATPAVLALSFLSACAGTSGTVAPAPAENAEPVSGDEGALAPATKSKGPAHVVFLVGEPEYKTETSLPAYADSDLSPLGFRYTFVFADPGNEHSFSGLERAGDFDLLFLSTRRRALTAAQMKIVRDHIAAGKPVVGVRTASHGFALRLEQGDKVPEGHESWQNFDVEVLGARYGNHVNKYGHHVASVKGAEAHAILGGEALAFYSKATLYRSTDLSPTAEVLLEGTSIDNDGSPAVFPVAWTNTVGGARIVYTSLGHTADFQDAGFRRFLTRAVQWALGQNPG